MRQVDTTGRSGIDRVPDERRSGTDTTPDRAADTIAFEAAETRTDDMRRTIETWLEDLVDLADEARASDAFRAWLDVHSRFHGYSYRNTVLIYHQRPSATRVAGYRTWQEAFDRQVRAGERAIWIWAPIIAKRCPACGTSQSYHEASDCESDDVPPEAWSTGVVAFKPVPVFDVAQTDGEPIPELETAATGGGPALVDGLLAAADDLGVDAAVVPRTAWEHGDAEGICTLSGSTTKRPRIEVRDRPDTGAVAGTLLHEYAHARLHLDAEAPAERATREVEAEAVAYIVGRYVGLDTSNSAFYLAAWRDDEPATVGERLDRISATANELIEVVESREGDPGVDLAGASSTR